MFEGRTLLDKEKNEWNHNYNFHSWQSHEVAEKFISDLLAVHTATDWPVLDSWMAEPDLDFTATDLSFDQRWWQKSEPVEHMSIGRFESLSTERKIEELKD